MTDTIISNVRQRIREIDGVVVRPLNREVSVSNFELEKAAAERNHPGAVLLIWGSSVPRQGDQFELIVNVEELGKEKRLPELSPDLFGQSRELVDRVVSRVEVAEEVSFVATMLAGIAQYEQKNWENAVDLFSDAIGQARDRAIALDQYILYDYHRKALRELAPEEAIRFFEDRLNASGRTPEAYTDLGLAYLDDGQFDKAIENFTIAIDISEEPFAPAYHRRALAHRGLRQFKEAIEDETVVIQVLPEFAGAYLSRAIAYEGLRQYEQAVEDLREGRRHKPDYYPLYAHLGIPIVSWVATRRLWWNSPPQLGLLRMGTMPIWIAVGCIFSAGIWTLL